MESFFLIRFEFDHAAVRRRIAEAVAARRPCYICVADGNVLAHVHRNEAYRQTVNEALFSICDSGWVPLCLRLLYGIRRPRYCGAQIFRDIVSDGRCRMAFLGTDDATLASLRRAIAPWNSAVRDMPFIALPFREAGGFDYPAIAARLEADGGADIIWVALGAPKQDFFMQRLVPHLHGGVALGVGAVFNFYSGRVRRAPAWVRALRLEFAFRLLAEPRKQSARCRRILAALPSVFLRELRRKRAALAPDTRPQA